MAGALTVPRASRRRWPFAVGLVLIPDPQAGAAGDELGDAGRCRLAVALAAHEAGFYLLDVIEVASGTGLTARDWARLWSLVVRTDAEAVFVLGLDALELEVLEPMADELRLVIRVVPSDAAGSSRSGGGDSTGGGDGGCGTGPAAAGVLAVDLGRDVGGPGSVSGGCGGEWFAPWTTER